LGWPFELTWPEGKEQVGHMPDLLCRMLEGQVVVIDCHSVSRTNAASRIPLKKLRAAAGRER
jgi:hypothetical protein